MNKINWKVRFRNRLWLVEFTGVIVTFIYQVLGLFGVVPAISQDTVTQLIGIILNMLAVLGTIQDPTTAGITDSEQALTYEVPKTHEE